MNTQATAGESLVTATESSTASTTDPRPVPRPGRSDIRVLRAAVTAMEPDISLWMGGVVTDDERADIIDAICWSSDAYDRARTLDRKGWDVDHALVELLSEADSQIYRAHDAAVKEWLAATDARPQLSVGANVTLPPGTDAGLRGEITAISETVGTYTVFVPSLGHVREGLGTHGRIFAWEVLESANEL